MHLRGRGSWGGKAWNREGSGRVLSMHVINVMGNSKEDGPDLLLGTTEKRHEEMDTNYGNFHWNKRRKKTHPSPLKRGVQHWNRLPGQVLESPSLLIFRTRLDVVVLRNLLGAGAFGLGSPQVLLQPQPPSDAVVATVLQDRTFLPL